MKNRLPDHQHISYTLCDEINAFIKPLRDLFSVIAFSYNRYYWFGNKFFSLGSSKGAFDYYWDNKLYQYCDGLPHTLLTKYSFMDDFNLDTEYGNKVARPLQRLLKAGQTVCITQHHLGYSEFITFSAAEGHDEFYMDFLHNKELFYQFINYFKSHFKRVLRDAYRHSYSHPEKVKIRFEKSKARKIETGLGQVKNMGLATTVEGEDVFFTKRETDILSYLSHKINFKSIAKALGTSHNTIQNQTNRIRQKLHCENKRELLNKIEKYQLNQQALNFRGMKKLTDDGDYCNLLANVMQKQQPYLVHFDNRFKKDFLKTLQSNQEVYKEIAEN